METSPTKNRKIVLQLLLLLGICLALAAVLAYFGMFKSPTADRVMDFQVNATGGYALITLQAGSVNMSSSTTVNTPWQQEVSVKSGTEVILTASNPSQDGQLSCAISLDHLPWKDDKINSPKDGVACAGIVP
ncbi:MAG: hypothetical protein P4L50_01695 [Anaerolineaceae bacterium]|nr:hypothetical protein [Anaerolineaceae bacterium]